MQAPRLLTVPCCHCPRCWWCPPRMCCLCQQRAVIHKCSRPILYHRARSSHATRPGSECRDERCGVRVRWRWACRLRTFRSFRRDVGACSTSTAMLLVDGIVMAGRTFDGHALDSFGGVNVHVARNTLALLRAGGTAGACGFCGALNHFASRVVPPAERLALRERRRASGTWRRALGGTCSWAATVWLVIACARIFR